jgi:hypothetical protein
MLSGINALRIHSGPRFAKRRLLVRSSLRCVPTDRFNMLPRAKVLRIHTGPQFAKDAGLIWPLCTPCCTCSRADGNGEIRHVIAESTLNNLHSGLQFAKRSLFLRNSSRYVLLALVAGNWKIWQVVAHESTSNQFRTTVRKKTPLSRAFLRCVLDSLGASNKQFRGLLAYKSTSKYI